MWVRVHLCAGNLHRFLGRLWKTQGSSLNLEHTIFVDWPASSKDPLLSASPGLTLQVHTPGPVLLLVVWFDCFGFCLFLYLFNVDSVDQTQHAFLTSISPIEPFAWSSLAILMSSLKKMITQSMPPCLGEVFLFCPGCLPLSWGSPLHSVTSSHFINTRFVNLFFQSLGCLLLFPFLCKIL